MKEQIPLRQSVIAHFSPDEEDTTSSNHLHAKAHLVKGGQNYDIIDQYEKHRHFLHLSN